jgi:tetratricopeptide (TPR) repeat protein
MGVWPLRRLPAVCSIFFSSDWGAFSCPPRNEDDKMRKWRGDNVMGYGDREGGARCGKGVERRSQAPSRHLFIFSSLPLFTLSFCLALAASTLVVYWPALSAPFLNYDDDDYVTRNPHVQAGLTPSGYEWAFTTTHSYNWHPLTWLSLQLDAQLFGSKSWGYHLTNVLLHTANVLLLFTALWRMTKSLWPSVFVAALFALHPLHVESVAWISERKDVLSTFYWMLTLLAYSSYVKSVETGGEESERVEGCRGERATTAPRPLVPVHPRPLASFHRFIAARYFLVLVLFALGLMAKPMLVTLPFVLLLLDYWPLNRLRFQPFSLSPFKEKIPLFALSAASCLITFYAQRAGGSVKSMEFAPFPTRVLNSLAATVIYIRKMFWPNDLAVFYPYNRTPTLLWYGLGAGLLLAAVSFLVIYESRRRPFLAVGWFWYLGTLIPVIGLVQVGDQAYADRYTYIPLIGLFIMLAWGVPKLLAGRRFGSVVMRFAGGSVVLACMIWSRVQLGYWQDDITLWRHALAVAPDSLVAHNNLALDLSRQGQIEEALGHFDAALRLEPRYEPARKAQRLLRGQLHLKQGASWYAQGNLGEAVKQYRAALQLVPDDALGYYELGAMLLQEEKRGPAFLDEAVQCFHQSLALQPRLVKAHSALALALLEQGQRESAAAEFKQALALDPNWPRVANHQAWLLATHPNPQRRNGRLAILIARQACGATGDAEPNFMDTMAAAYAETGQFDKAVAVAGKARELALAAKQSDAAQEIAQRLDLYRAGRPFRDTSERRGLSPP